MPIHPVWLGVILIAVLIIFGPGRLPELGGAVGKAMREFRNATNEVTSATQAKPELPRSAPAPTSESAAQDVHVGG